MHLDENVFEDYNAPTFNRNPKGFIIRLILVILLNGGVFILFIPSIGEVKLSVFIAPTFFVFINFIIAWYYVLQYKIAIRFYKKPIDELTLLKWIRYHYFLKIWVILSGGAALAQLLYNL